MSIQHSRIRVGPAGWSYKDWEGIVYPPHGSKFDHLAFLAGYFDTIEVNSSFYRIPPPSHAESWIRRVEVNPEFRFTVKLFRGFTHDEEALTGDDVAAFRRFLDPLAEAGRLGALLIQFPWSFKASEESIRHLRHVLDEFGSYPGAVEVRHASFDSEGFRDLLRERRVALANIDQPLFSDSIKPAAEVTAPVSYVRLHGRNYEKWFAHQESWERYNYLYAPEELEPWVERAKAMSTESDVFVITNNHFRGQAIVNAAEMKLALGQCSDVPETLRLAYPDRVI